MAWTLCGLLSAAWTASPPAAWFDHATRADEPAKVDIEAVATSLELIAEIDADATRQTLRLLADKLQSRELTGDALRALAERLAPTLASLLARDAGDPVRGDAVLLSATLGAAAGREGALAMLDREQETAELRQRAAGALIFAKDARVFPAIGRVLADLRPESRDLQGLLLAQLGRSDEPQVAELVLQRYSGLHVELRPKAIELLTQRPAWSHALLDAMASKQIPPTVLNANQVARLAAGKDEPLKKRVTAIWGTVRTERNPQREEVITRVRSELKKTAGDVQRGHKVFHRVCGQCHKIHGEGHEVGPDLTANGRSSLEQLLSNVLDPSLVIGASYQARIAVTEDGRVLTGLLAEESPQRVVLKLQGGKLETIARDELEELRVSPLSMMPEGLETQIQGQELIDLFAFLLAEKP